MYGPHILEFFTTFLQKEFKTITLLWKAYDTPISLLVLLHKTQKTLGKIPQLSHDNLITTVIFFVR